MKKNVKRVAVISDIHLLAQSEYVDALKPSNVDNKTTREQIKRLIKTARKLNDCVEDKEASEAHFVLNGDIFEYIYPRVEPEEVTRQAVNFMETLARRFPKCHFHYIHGNHDPSKELNEQLNQMTSEPLSPHHLANLTVHKTHCEIGDVLFTHGDILLGEHPNDANDKRMPRRLEDSSRVLRSEKDIKDGRIYEFLMSAGATAGSVVQGTRNVFSGIYSSLFLRRDLERDAAEELSKGLKKKSYRAKMGEFYSSMQYQIQRWVESFRSPIADARVLAGALAEEHPEKFDHINHVFTGHTHIPYAFLEVKDGISSKGFSIKLPKPIEFHNTGAPLAGAKVNLMTMDIIDGKATNIEVGKDFRKRLPYETDKGNFEDKMERYADDIREEAVEEWHKRVEKKTGISFDDPKWKR